MATQLDYYNTLLSSKAGQRVKFDLQKLILTWFRKPDRPMTADEARAQCMLDELAMLIDAKCGIDNEEAEMEMIGHQAVVAAARLEREEPEPEDVDLHKTQ